jgi:hopanoid biosynthesis associated RND transporter like protein HpnN
MPISIVATIVGISSRYAGAVVVGIVLLGVAAGEYAGHHFAMNTHTEDLISSQTQWRKREALYDAAFPQQNQLIDVVVDGVTPEQAEGAAAALATALHTQADLLPMVRRPDDGAFFSHDGLLFLPTSQVKEIMQQEIGAQAFLGALASDPSLRGIADNLSTALLGVKQGQAKLTDMDRPMASLARTLDAVLAGKPAFLSWRSLVTGAVPSIGETRRFIEVRPKLDYGELMPGARATAAIRNTISRLRLDERNGVRVRLTGPIPIADDEFGSLAERAQLMATLMMAAVLTMLWIALRSARLIFAVLLTVFTGLTITAAVGLLAVGAFNLISVAFIALFVGLGADFGIQFCVRYRAERHERNDLDLALIQTGAGIGGALTLAAAATAAGFYSFLPTSYRGVAELGFVAGTGMLITFTLSISFLPALVKLLAPPGEPEEIGFRALAPLDRFFRRRKRLVVFAALGAGVGGVALLPSLEFDFNPLDLRNPKVESVSTALELMKNPDTSPNTLDVLTRSHAAATRLAARLSALPQVSRTLTVDSFIPDRQTEKIAIIADADALLDPTLNPFLTKPPPDDAAVIASLRSAAGDLLAAAGAATGASAKDARDLAGAFQRLAQSNARARARAEQALVPGLKIMLDQARTSLAPYPVTAQSLPPDVMRDWVSPNGLYRVQVFPKGNSNDNGVLRAFTAAVRAVAPDAAGEPIVILESGRTIVRAFIQAGILSFIAIAIMLYAALRSIVLVALTLAPLVLAGVATMATCVAIGLPLNYANIIALPLLLGIGVAFDIYFVLAWRSGARDLLGSALTRAVILSAGTTASAFGTLWISSHPGTASMGELLAISLAWILVTVLFLLPALLAYAAPNIGLKRPAS